MESIKTPSDDFNFKELVLTSPITMNSGTHFIKYKLNDNQLYLQPPKCLIKQNITSKNQKRVYCDLLFTNENDEFLRWIENLEEYSKNYIFENRTNWFESELSEDDIEVSFTPMLKSYKGGKYYILRTLIPTYLGTINLKIYDENENNIEISQIKENDNVISALEIKGIKCSPRSFQVEIELKQLLLLNKENIFDKCILNKQPSLVKNRKEELIDLENNDEYLEKELPTNEKINESNEIIKEEEVSNNENKSDDLENKIIETVTLEEEANIVEKNEIEQEIIEENKEDKVHDEVKKEDEEINLQEKENDQENQNEIIKEENLEDKLCEPEEIDFPLEEIDDSEIVSIKKPNAIYYEMYKDALKKAKMAKDLALASYMEAKRIKNQYMLEDLEDSDLEDETFDNMED